ncbi:Gfo/Idh/MocA family protein [Marinoscillum sp. 108]|uniref:Gfo/Idh/MocA family protein n=1 Tax=Marinoscillum sp. 108 TaxID=2653151 RepID=UPI0012F2E5E0|nr:Gfo/Idh/MocA family oxidoreductase [Marinoscillum sp. 108]VXD14126.1 Predicted dehydrogenase [Marinoscillum sp. 108]
MKRRHFLSNTAKSTGSIMVASSLTTLGLLSGPSGRAGEKRGLGVALVGLGGYATGQLAPALERTENCYLAGIVTGTPSKADSWVDQYLIPSKNVYNYDNFDEISNNDEIDIVYVVLPNSMHAEFVIRAAQAGKHVICEKPMATKYEDCQRMIDACRKAEKKLSIGYRLHFEPHNLEVMRLGQRQVFGKVLESDAGFAFPLRDKSRWRLDKEMAGGGPLMDVGIYAIQSTIYTLGQLPIALQATDTTVDKAFYGAVEGTLDVKFDFPTGINAKMRTSYEESSNYLKVQAQEGNWELAPAYSYGGLKGRTHLGAMNFPAVNQQALQMDDFATCILKDKQSTVRGEMGQRDMFIIDKIYESAAAGKPVSLKGIPNILHLV